jgi:hypothetical protein
LRIAKTEFGFIKTKMIIRARGKLPLDRYHVYVFALQQKTAYFKVAIGSRVIQCSFSTEKKNTVNLRAKTELRFIEAIITAAITRSPSHSHQRCTGVKDGKLRGGGI